MKKYLWIAAALFVLNIFLPSSASVLKATALEEVSTSSPKEVISVKLAKKFILGDGIILKKGYILTGRMTDVQDPKKWHHNATFTFIPTYYKDLKGQEYPINQEIKATYRQKMQPDFKHSEITVGNLMFSPAYIDDTKKIIHGEAGEVWNDYANRSTPWGNGTQIDIKPNEVIYFNFPD